jgi:serine/threonine protein kinase
MNGIKDTISREMLECEIEALRTIQHENVLKCYDVVRETRYCYIITEYCNGGDLS